MKDDTLFWALCDMDEALILEAKEVPVMKKKTMKPMRIALIAAAITVLLAGAAFAVYQYTRSTESLAQRWETLGETEMPEEQKDYIESKSANIGESITDQGITITLDSITCTANTAYAMFHVEADPNVYDMEGVYGVFPIGMVMDQGVWVENDAFGTIYAGNGGASGDSQGENDYWYQFTFEFTHQLPADTRINDGNTTMYIQIGRVILQDNSEGATTDAPTVEGNWNFAVQLPASEESSAVSTDQELDFSNGVVLHISDLTVDESSVQFAVETDNEEYIFVGSGEQAELARMAEPDAPLFTVEAKLKDGTIVPTGGGGMTLDEKTDLDIWSIEWAAPLDPSQIKSLVFSDGTEQFEIELND